MTCHECLRTYKGVDLHIFSYNYIFHGFQLNMLYIVSSNQAHGEVYSIQHYVIKFVSDLWQVDGFLWVFSTNKTDCHDITEILSKVALNTINQTFNHLGVCCLLILVSCQPMLKLTTNYGFHELFFKQNISIL
jgi:hypothetical protein